MLDFLHYRLQNLPSLLNISTSKCVYFGCGSLFDLFEDWFNWIELRRAGRDVVKLNILFYKQLSKSRFIEVVISMNLVQIENQIQLLVSSLYIRAKGTSLEVCKKFLYDLVKLFS